MLTTEQIKQEITSAEKGSDIHGLAEKISYFLHQANKQNSADSNWYDAQDILLGWTEDKFRKKLREAPSFREEIHELLNNRAYESYQSRLFYHGALDEYADWMRAQHELGEQVLLQQGKIIVPLC